MPLEQPMMTRHPLLILSLLLLALLAVACAVPTVSPSPSQAAPTEFSTPTGTPATTPTPMGAPASCPSFDSSMQASFSAVERQVSELRGLSPLTVPAYDWLFREDIEERVQADFLSDYSEEDAFADQQMLLALGLIDDRFDLLDFYLAFYSEQLAGYYDPGSGSIVLVCSDEMGGPERVTYVREYTHALLDQHYDLTDGLNYSPSACKNDPDRCAALEALIEGDTVLLQSQWLRTYAAQEDVTELDNFLAGFSSPVFDQAPPFLQEDLLFPYFEGQSFVHALYLDGGWAAVDAIYANPPVSTEQILHPERYPHDERVLINPPQLLSILGDGWTQPVDTILGEFLLRTVLASQLPESDAVSVAEGWGGDHFSVFLHEPSDSWAAVLISQWDTVADAHEFYFGLRDYATGRFDEPSRSETGLTQWAQDDIQVEIRLLSNQVLFILAPDTSTLIALDGALPLPLSSQP